MRSRVENERTGQGRAGEFVQAQRDNERTGQGRAGEFVRAEREDARVENVRDSSSVIEPREPAARELNALQQIQLPTFVPDQILLQGLTDEQIKREGFLILSGSLDPDEPGINSRAMGSVDGDSKCKT